MTVIKLTIEGSIKSVEFIGFRAGKKPIHEINLGEYTDGTATVLGRRTEPIPMTQRQYDNIKAFMDEEVVYDADTVIDFPETNAQLKADINNLGTHHIGFLERFDAIEKALATLGIMDKRVFVKWIVRGTEFQCEMPNVDDGLASFDLKSGFDGFSEDLNPDDPNDTRQMMYLKTREFGTFRIITARQELGRIRDAVNANAAEAVHSEALPETEPAE